MNFTNCPYCKNDIEDYVYFHWDNDPYEYFKGFVCPFCSGVFDIDVEIGPYFNIKKGHKS